MLNRSGSRSSPRSKTELPMTRANGWKSLTDIEKDSILDPARVLDPTVIIILTIDVWFFNIL